MKRVAIMSFIFMLLTAVCSFSYAGGGPEAVETREVATKGAGSALPYRLQVGEKVARGTKNIVFGWTELPKRIVDLTTETNNPIWGFFAGTYQGVLKALTRTVSGVSDVVTAPIRPDRGPFVQADIDVE